MRNIRAYQSRRLLQAPDMRGRVGYYGPQHVARIELVQRLQGEGFNLHAITALVERGDAFVAGVEQLRRDLKAEAVDGWIPMSEEEQRLCEENSPGSLERFARIGTIRVADDGGLMTHPRLSEAGWSLNLLGVAPETIIDLLFVTHKMIRRVGDVYVDVLHERLVSSVTEPGDEEVKAVHGVFDELTPHAVQLMTTLFEIVLRKEAAESLERTLRQLPPTA